MKFDLLRQFIIDNDLKISDEQIIKYESFAETLVETNRVMNLTAITDPEQIEIKHMIDSLEGAIVINDLAEEDFSLLDIGCGPGFPGIPLKIAYPENRFVLLDSLNKRINFVNTVIKKLGLWNIEAICSRAEDYDHKAEFDICVSRAVAEMNVLLEYSLPFVKIGGYCMLYKSGDIDREIQESEKALEVLGGRIHKIYNFDLPSGYGDRTLVIVKKDALTPDKYPRRAGKPSKSPIR